MDLFSIGSAITKAEVLFQNYGNGPRKIGVKVKTGLIYLSLLKTLASKETMRSQ